MSDRMALKTAIDLIHVPSQVRLLRMEPLPDGVVTLLRIAAGDEEAENTASLLADRPRDVVRHAATFFIEQILFAPNADSYRVLGTNARASPSDLRRNVALLLRWLHPDLDSRGDRSVFVGRVTAAWNDLKTPERRAVYDEALRSLGTGRKSLSRNGKSRSGRRRSGKLFGQVGSNSGGRNGQMLRDADRMGFFRRALAVLLHRPPQ
jgi:hypothetical protein